MWPITRPSSYDVPSHQHLEIFRADLYDQSESIRGLRGVFDETWSCYDHADELAPLTKRAVANYRERLLKVQKEIDNLESMIENIWLRAIRESKLARSLLRRKPPLPPCRPDQCRPGLPGKLHKTKLSHSPQSRGPSNYTGADRPPGAVIIDLTGSSSEPTGHTDDEDEPSDRDYASNGNVDQDSNGNQDSDDQGSDPNEDSDDQGSDPSEDSDAHEDSESNQSSSEHESSSEDASSGSHNSNKENESPPHAAGHGRGKHPPYPPRVINDSQDSDDQGSDPVEDSDAQEESDAHEDSGPNEDSEPDASDHDSSNDDASTGSHNSNEENESPPHDAGRGRGKHPPRPPGAVVIDLITPSPPPPTNRGRGRPPGRGRGRGRGGHIGGSNRPAPQPIPPNTIIIDITHSSGPSQSPPQALLPTQRRDPAPFTPPRQTARQPPPDRNVGRGQGARPTRPVTRKRARDEDAVEDDEPPVPKRPRRTTRVTDRGSPSYRHSPPAEQGSKRPPRKHRRPVSKFRPWRDEDPAKRPPPTSYLPKNTPTEVWDAPDEEVEEEEVVEAVEEEEEEVEEEEEYEWNPPEEV